MVYQVTYLIPANNIHMLRKSWFVAIFDTTHYQNNYLLYNRPSIIDQFSLTMQTFYFMLQYE
jgi:hypothetical protein